MLVKRLIGLYDHNKIGSMYKEKEDYWLNIENGKYKLVGSDTE